MNFKIYKYGESDGLNLPTTEFGVTPVIFRKFLADNSVGFVETRISCREVMYIKFEYSNFIEDLFATRYVRGFHIAERRPKEQAESFLEKTVFKQWFYVDEENYVSSNYFISPQIWSILILFLRDFPDWDLEKIPLQILRTKANSHYGKDYIFTAYFANILLDKKYEKSANKLIGNPYFSKSNGPGQEIYKSFFNHLNLTDLSGYSNASDWWTKPEIKEELEKLKYYGTGKLGKLIKFLTGGMNV